MKPAEIDELLRLKDWTAKQLADELDMHESTVSLWRSGDRTPTGGTRKLLRRMLEDARRAGKQPAAAAS